MRCRFCGDKQYVYHPETRIKIPAKYPSDVINLTCQNCIQIFLGKGFNFIPWDGIPEKKELKLQRGLQKSAVDRRLLLAV